MELKCESCNKLIGDRDIYMAYNFNVLCPSCYRFKSRMIEILEGEPEKQSHFFKGGQ